MLDEIKLPGLLGLRSTKPEDEPFVTRLFRSTRSHLELPGVPDEVVSALIAQQQQLQKDHYTTQWPTAISLIILLAGQTIGRIIINAENDSLHIIDFAFMPEYRGKGYGTALLRAIQRVAKQNQLSIKLSVDNQNHLAKKLYLSLGFNITDHSDTHEWMIWTPTSDQINRTGPPNS